MAYFKVTKEILEQFNISETDAANQVNTMKDIIGNRIWVMFVESENQIRVRIRSAETPINNIARQYDGGGHPLASGATVSTWAEADSLISDLVALLNN